MEQSKQLQFQYKLPEEKAEQLETAFCNFR